jgi:hypothetical protein
MGRTSNLTIEQLTAERPKRPSVGGAMRYLATCSPEERVEALARADAAFAEIKSGPIKFIGPGVPKARTDLYLKKNLVPAVFVMLEDHRADRGTMRASTDGSFRRAFNFSTKGMVVEQDTGGLMLVAIPRRTRAWINRKFSASRLGWPGGIELAGEWTEEQRATWKLLYETADMTETFIDKARRPAPRRRTYAGISPW